MSEIQKLIIENKMLNDRVENLKKAYITKIKQKNKEIELKDNEIKKLKDKIHKLKNEKGVYNERGAGRKSKFTDHDKEVIKMYRMQGKTIKEIAEMYNCSVGLIHKIINENN